VFRAGDPQGSQAGECIRHLPCAPLPQYLLRCAWFASITPSSPLPSCRSLTLVTYAVSPTALLPLPLVYTPRGATRWMKPSSWLLDTLGSPTTSTLMSPRLPAALGGVCGGRRRQQKGGVQPCNQLTLAALSAGKLCNEQHFAQQSDRG
jgi:hypothetical protein